MTVLEVIQRSAQYLGKRGVDSPRLQAELLLAHALGLPRLKLYLDFERALSNAELETVRALVKRRGAREPLQHLLGTVSFCGLDLAVNPGVLVPRPETETLAEHAWRFLNSVPADAEPPPQALDFGTGSGCLAIALAVKCPRARITAIDLSPEALVVARQNASRHHLGDRIEFLQSDAFAALPDASRFDLIVANPPYIPTGEIAGLQLEVREFDPRLALDGGADGLEFFRRLAADARRFMSRTALLMAEFGDGQAAAVEKIFADSGWKQERLEPDLSGRPRVLVATPASA